MRLCRWYHFREVEGKWQALWKTSQPVERSGPAFYCLSMFPYPSGNLHLGHTRVYSISDAIARYESVRGKRVLHPMGWDSFGLPAENAARDRGVAPDQWTTANISTMKQQMQAMGFDFHWDKELSTCQPDYYRWTQDLFLRLYRQGLAYQQQGYLNWDPVDQTVLANEQVDEQGRSWRSGAVVERRLMKQWYFKITQYAEELLSSLKDLQWPEAVKDMQAGWIGKSQGARVQFRLKDREETVEVFTTRIDTLYGVTFLALAPEHPLISKFPLPADIRSQLQAITTKAETHRKMGQSSLILPGIRAIHPLTGQEMPVIAAEYVLQNYGTGCVMGVPDQDERDKKVAETLKLETIKVYNKEGKLINSGTFSGLKSNAAKFAILQHCESKKIAISAHSFRLRDWLVSRQRYWGVPIPIIHCPSCGPVPEPNLPLLLPQIQHKSAWLHTKCPKCGTAALRETDTLDTFVDSSWYFLRYPDTGNRTEMFSREKAKQWLPVNLYIGGIEHAILHLLYSRFITKFVRDEGMVECGEPFKQLFTQGLVLGKTYKHKGRYISAAEATDLTDVEISYEKMSKSKGNGVSPTDLIAEVGADVLRLALLFAAPSDSQIQWEPNLLRTMERFLRSVWELVEERPLPTDASYAKWVKGVTNCMEKRKLHVAVARCMELTTQLKTAPCGNGLKTLLIALYPLAPHFSAEAYWSLQQSDIRNANWP